MRVRVSAYAFVAQGRERFCRLSVPEHAKNTWRIVYEWPPLSGASDDLIWVWLVREHTERPESDVYLWLDALVQRQGVAVEPWSVSEPRRRCCEDLEQMALGGAGSR